MSAIPRFISPDGAHFCFEYWLRGKWRKDWRFGLNQEAADQRAIEYFQHIGGGAVMVIRRADTKLVIWERESYKPKERVNGTDQAG